MADRIIKVALLLPAEQKTLRELSLHAQVAEKTFAGADDGVSQDVFQAAWRSVSLALLEYRRADYLQAANWCRRCLAYPEHNAPRSATACVILAMSCWRMNQREAARTELSQGEKLIEDKFRSGLDRGTGVQGFWFDWVFARILLREAKLLIGTEH